MLSAYLMSHLVRLYSTQESELNEKLPPNWLVWEPSSYTAPKVTDATVSKASGRVTNRRPLTGSDAFCYGLELDSSQQARLRVGRAPACDIQVNDSTVSREHVALVGAPSGWTVEALSNRITWHRGSLLGKGMSAHLENGDELRLGELKMTFLTTEGLKARLGKELARQLTL